MLARTDSHELSEWLAFYSIHPWGEERADLRQAVTSTVVANSLRGKNVRPYKIEDFLPVPSAKPEQTADEMKALLMQLCPIEEP